MVPVLCVTSTGSEDSCSCSVSASPDSTLCFTLLAASRSRKGGKNERRKIKVIVGFRDRLPSDSSSSPTPCHQLPNLTFTISVQLSSLTLTSVNTPLPYHLPLHPVTVTTSQPPRSALRCVPLTDSCFTFPLVLPQPKTHSLSASSMQDPSALPGGGPTYPPSFRTTTSTSCC